MRLSISGAAAAATITDLGQQQTFIASGYDALALAADQLGILAAHLGACKSIRRSTPNLPRD